MFNKLRETVTAIRRLRLTISERPRIKRGAWAGLAAARAHVLLLLVLGVVQRRHGGVVLHGGAGQRDRHRDERRLFQLSQSILSNSIADFNFSQGTAVIMNVGLCLIKELRTFSKGVVGAILCLYLDHL